ncbi:HNH endonuclease signature motif containing protein, partial [Gordonia sp. (in: high G+C Gram-positive bacteria)]|uniref:HNH endonuclease signature motif containing protein n=1 Tax=Gordonia sp. (in: high G+C Gram-positive bacteria) TaxID=84139 RepID=UPI0016B3EED8
NIPLRRKLKTGPDLLLAIGVAPVVAQRMGRLGRALHRFPTVAAGMRDGHTSAEFADAVVKGTEHIRRRVELSTEQRDKIIRTLSVQLNPAAVMKRARAFAIELAPEPDALPEGAVPVAENTDLNEMTLTQTDDGRFVAELDLDVLNGDALVTALDPLTKPIPQPDGSADPRSPARRRGDALAEIVRAYLYGYDRPTSGGVLPTVTVVRQAPVITSGLEIAIPELPDGVVRQADSLGFGGPITATSAELIACDAAVSEVLVDSEGVPLDVGRSQRLFTGKLRKALEVRDRGCAFPGCDRPAKWCDGHHMTPWSEGGATCLDNGVLLCRAHHTMVHHTGWEVLLGPDRHPWFRPPADPEHPDRRRELIRSNARRTMTLYEHAAA